jgi:hypothetical protein
MSEPSHNEARAELERLGWQVELKEDLGWWELQAVRGERLWMCFCATPEKAWAAALTMARRHGPNQADSD